MRLQLTTKQIMSANKLLEELKEFVNKGYGTISKILVLKYSLMHQQEKHISQFHQQRE